MADEIHMLRSVTSSKTKSGKNPVAGGRSLGLTAAGTEQIIRQVQRGFPYIAIIRLHHVSGLPISSIADLLQIPQRTLMRRKAEGRLTSEESERLLRVSGIFEKAASLFEGDAHAARHWLTTPSRELAGQSPLEFARTEIGSRDVEDLIGRLEYGVFA